MWINLLVTLAIVIALNLYGYYGLRKFLKFDYARRYRKKIITVYWVMDLSFLVFSFVWALIIRNSGWADYVQYRNFFYITGAFLLIYLPKIAFIIFNFFDDILLLIKFLYGKLFKEVLWSQRRSSVLLLSGVIFSVIVFLWVFYGITYGRFHYKVTPVEVKIKDLPSSFDGFRIVHISDTHFGSFARIRPVDRSIKMIQEIPHDILVFTGDMVNNEAVEAEKFVELFQQVESPYGKYSILGNHDMGDYRRWYTIEEKMANLEQLEDIQQQMGFVLLRNEHEFIEKDGDSLMIAGVDNWGVPPFGQYGDLKKALGENADFFPALFLSHDPSHWKEEVIPDTNIPLTLSGHTHGMQAGITTPFFRWSPVSVKYKEWGGLYAYGNQFLYVNTGLGFIGFPGRMGMRPEITLITLVKDNHELH